MQKTLETRIHRPHRRISLIRTHPRIFSGEIKCRLMEALLRLGKLEVKLLRLRRLRKKDLFLGLRLIRLIRSGLFSAESLGRIGLVALNGDGNFLFRKVFISYMSFNLSALG